MALVATGDAPVLLELLADGRGAADVRVERLDVGRRRGRRRAQDVLEQPDAADHGRGVDAVGRHGQHARLAEQAAAAAVAQADLLEAAAPGRRQPVVPRQRLVDEREVGIEEVRDAQVVVEQVPREEARLLAHRGLEVVAVVIARTCRGRGASSRGRAASASYRGSRRRTRPSGDPGASSGPAPPGRPARATAPVAARSRSGRSGIEDQRKYDSREAKRMRRQSPVAGLVEVQEAGRAEHGAQAVAVGLQRRPAGLPTQRDQLHQAIDLFRPRPGAGTPAR